MSATPAPTAKEPAKSKKLIVIGAVVALLVIVAAAAGLFLVNKQRSAGADEDGDEPKAKAAAVVPTFLPMENMVVNLADAGGDRFAQVGITLELEDEATATAVKQFMPSIRNGVLMLVSQSTSEELLRREGKEKLAEAILAEVARPLGGRPAAKRPAAEGEEDERPRPRKSSPVRRVLFSSFIIQ